MACLVEIGLQIMENRQKRFRDIRKKESNYEKSFQRKALDYNLLCILFKI